MNQDFGYENTDKRYGVGNWFYTEQECICYAIDKRYEVQ